MSCVLRFACDKTSTNNRVDAAVNHSLYRSDRPPARGRGRGAGSDFKDVAEELAEHFLVALQATHIHGRPGHTQVTIGGASSARFVFVLFCQTLFCACCALPKRGGRLGASALRTKKARSSEHQRTGKTSFVVLFNSGVEVRPALAVWPISSAWSGCGLPTPTARKKEN